MDAVELRGLDLRSLLVLVLLDAGRPLTVEELVRRVGAAGFSSAGPRPGKTVADALRWEVARGRAVRSARGRFAAGRVAKVTRHRMRQRVATARRLGHGAHLPTA